LARISQEVTKTILQPVGRSLSSRWYCSILSWTENLFATCKFDRCSNLASKLPVRRWRSRRFRRVPPLRTRKRLFNTLTELEAALLACWVPPPMEQSRLGMQITVLMSFRRNGELFGQPRITFQSREASETERLSYRIAVAQMLKQCASLPFTEALGNTVAGQPLTMTFVDDREQPP
jgi:hypothetical protein